MSWVNVGTIKGDTGATGATGATGSDGDNVRIIKDSAHGFIYFGSGEDEVFLYLSEIKDRKVILVQLVLPVLLILFQV